MVKENIGKNDVDTVYLFYRDFYDSGIMKELFLYIQKHYMSPTTFDENERWYFLPFKKNS